MDMIDLLPCPFCGAAEHLRVEHLEGTILHPAYRVLCDNCGASTGYTDKDCRADWNTRAAPPPPAEQGGGGLIERLRALLPELEFSRGTHVEWRDCDQKYRDQNPRIGNAAFHAQCVRDYDERIACIHAAIAALSQRPVVDEAKSSAWDAAPSWAQFLVFTGGQSFWTENEPFVIFDDPERYEWRGRWQYANVPAKRGVLRFYRRIAPQQPTGEEG